MRIIVLLAATAALVACQKTATPVANDTGMTADNAMTDGNTAMTPVAFQINETTWQFSDPKGKAMTESVDAAGKYVTVSGAEHIDHGTAVMKDGKACFTSAMTKDGEECWTTSPVAVGQSMDTTSDKGTKLKVKRVAYVALPMPSPAAT